MIAPWSYLFPLAAPTLFSGTVAGVTPLVTRPKSLRGLLTSFRPVLW